MAHHLSEAREESPRLWEALGFRVWGFRGLGA